MKIDFKSIAIGLGVGGLGWLAYTKMIKPNQNPQSQLTQQQIAAYSAQLQAQQSQQGQQSVINNIINNVPNLLDAILSNVGKNNGSQFSNGGTIPSLDGSNLSFGINGVQGQNIGNLFIG